MTSPATPPPPAAAGPWTTRRLLDWMTGAFESKGLDEPRLCAEMLLAHTLGCQRLRLYMEADRPATDAERERLRTLVGRALKHEPIQYLIGRWPFFGIELKCDRRALIPRPSTETIVESVLQWRRGLDGPPKSTVAKISDFESPEPGELGEGEGAGAEGAAATPREPAPPAPEAPELRIADICCGGGAITIALAKNLPRARIIATDLSEDALGLAAENIAEHGLGDRVELRRGDLLAPLGAGRPWVPPPSRGGVAHATSDPRSGSGGADSRSGAGGSGSSGMKREDPSGRGPWGPGGYPFDIIVSNPPYIPDDEWAEVEANVRDYEPEMALRAPPDGMTFARPILAGAGALLAPGGRIFIEVAASRADEAREFAATCGLADPRIIKDIDGLPRIIAAHRPR